MHIPVELVEIAIHAASCPLTRLRGVIAVPYVYRRFPRAERIKLQWAVHCASECKNEVDWDQFDREFPRSLGALYSQRYYRVRVSTRKVVVR